MYQKDPIQRAIDAEKFFVDALEDWRETLQLPKMFLIGHSLGGYCAAACMFMMLKYVCLFYSQRFPRHI